MIPAFHAHVGLLVLLAAAFVMAALASLPAQAQQVDESLPPLADLSIASEYNDERRETTVQWDVTVKNNAVGAHPGAHVPLVKVRLTLSDDVRGATTQTWTIRNLPPGGSATRLVTSLKLTPGTTEGPAKVPQRLHAEIIESDPVESPRFRSNNATEHWAIEHRRAVSIGNGVTRFTNGDVAVDVASISDRNPQPGGATTFTVAAHNFPEFLAVVAPGLQDHTQFDVQVEISLSPGLSLAANQQAPSSGTFDTSTGTWNVGTMGHVRSESALSLPVAVNLTSESLSARPLEERCLTAKVVRAVPWFASDALKRVNDIATACLGEPEGLVTQGETTLFHVLDCFGETSPPCTDADTLELVVERDDVYLQPEDVVVHVQDLQGRQSNDETWHTGQPGVVHTVDTRDLAIPGTWTHHKRSISVPDGVTLPGSFSIRPSTNPGFNFLDPVNAKAVGPFALTGAFASEQFVKFGALGTYRVTPAFDFTHKTIDTDMDGNKDVFSASGTYTFHVGPAADLEVRDAGANPEVGGRQWAYTVTAVNNGPQAAPAVEVTLTGVPQGAQAIASEGDYDSATGVWTIGELGLSDPRASGLAGHPTLTLVTAGANPGPISAEIETMEDYCVRIKTGDAGPENDLDCAGNLPTGYTEHSAAYYDHDEDNNTATVQARAGTASEAGPAGAPRSLRVQRHGAIAILWWAWMDTVNGFPVTHFQVERNSVMVATDILENQYVDLDVVDEPHRSYRVRAVNEFGVPGPWSLPAGGVMTDAPGAPTGLTASPSDVVGRIVLSWFPPSADDDLRYRIEYSRDGRSWQVLHTGHGGLTYTHDGLAPATIQYYRVATVKDGLTSAWASAQGTTKTEPGAPAGLTATAGHGVGRIDLAWYPPFAVSGLRYRIEHAASADGPWRVLSGSYDGLTYSHRDLLAGTTHYYRVATIQDGVTSGWAYAHATTDAQPVLDDQGNTIHVVHMVPMWPEYLRFSSVDRTSVTLVWDPPVDDGGTPVTGYEYRVFGPCPSGADDVCDVVPPTRVSGTSRRITGLNREGTYDFQVRALNAVGAGDWSQSVQKTVGPATAGGGRVILSPSRLTVPEGGEATYRVKLSRAPTQPLWVGLHWEGDEDLGAGLPFQQSLALLPSGYDTSGLPDCPSIPGYDWDTMAYAWNVGVPITVTAREDDDSENGRLTILHDIYTVPENCLANPAGYAYDPVYDGLLGLALEVTERDND